MPPDTWLILLLLVVLAAAAIATFWCLRLRARLERAEAGRARVERAQAKVASLAADAERVRIVREMHDVIAHSLAVMIAQADGGSYAAADHPTASRTFATIAETGRAALNDTRRILGVLRHGEAVELTPVPTDAPLEELANNALQAGLEVSLVRVGTEHELLPATRLALYRICQESLTNALKHAGQGTRVLVSVAWGEDAVELTITDSGGVASQMADADPDAGLGLGLIGMRERAELVGGTLHAGPGQSGFRVQARLPLSPLEGNES